MPPPNLHESLKTCYFIIYGASHPNGRGLERFWIPSHHSPEVLASCIDEPPEVWTSKLVYMPCAGMPGDLRQHALTVCGYALESQHLMVRGTPIVEVQPLEDPQPRTKRRLLSRHLSRHRIPPPEPENPAYKSIHRHALLYAFADRQHIVRGTRTTERNRRHAHLALGRAWAAAAATSPVLTSVFETPHA
ncbi:hypothetical protein B0H13DRAFT_2320391 [Mycena leptocephala]|nr:hypothetical protein B0H13DRAFT_2320391 [Mycena leptocephala]